MGKVESNHADLASSWFRLSNLHCSSLPSGSGSILAYRNLKDLGSEVGNIGNQVFNSCHH